jgi:hypothetical protein
MSTKKEPLSYEEAQSMNSSPPEPVFTHFLFYNHPKDSQKNFFSPVLIVGEILGFAFKQLVQCSYLFPEGKHLQ